METLQWEPFLRSQAVSSAYHDLLALTARAVSLHPRSQAPRVPHAFWSASRDKIYVFVNETSPLVSHEIVHEVIHAILMEEGYHRLTVRCSGGVPMILSNELQHPEVFRRMEAYGLDMEPYWDPWRSQLQSLIDTMRNDPVHPYTDFWDFPQIFTWFFFPPAFATYLNQYRDINPAVHDAARHAYDEAKTVGLHTPEAHLQYLAIFKEHWFSYCDRHLPRDEGGILRIACARDSVAKRVSETANSRTEQHLIDDVTNSDFQ